MHGQQLLQEIEILPPELQKQVSDFVVFLRKQQQKQFIKKRTVGEYKNKIFIHEDFDEPITTYSECIPLISQLNHIDKLRLAQWLIKAIAQEEGVNDVDNVGNQTGLCGIWQDSRSGDEILQEIVNSRTSARDIAVR